MTPLIRHRDGEPRERPLTRDARIAASRRARRRVLIAALLLALAAARSAPAQTAPGSALARPGAGSEERGWPRLWQEPLFAAVVATAVALLALAAVHLRERSHASREAHLRLEVEARARELEEARDALEESNERLELRVLEGIDRLRDTERMAAYGEMVAGVAHEVRNPLFALQSAAWVLGQELQGRPDLASQLRTIEREAKRMARLMDELLDFARPRELLLQAVEPRTLLLEAVELLRAEKNPEGIEIRIDAAPDLPRVVLDRDRILQVLLNLMENAHKYARGMSQLTLSAGPALRYDLSQRPWLFLRVADDGAGISQADRARVFEPFFTTGKGSGLGLAIARRIVSDHEGTIEVESEPGRGTAFSIFLPVPGPLRSAPAPSPGATG